MKQHHLEIFCKLSVMQSIAQMIFKLVSVKVALKDEGFEVIHLIVLN